MANKKQLNHLKTSLETIRQINWFDDIEKLPNDVDKILLDQCSDIIEEFLNSNEFLLRKEIESKSELQKRQVSKIKKSKLKVKKIKQSKLNKTHQKIKGKVKKLKQNIQSFNYTNTSSTSDYPCYPSAFPCFRSCGPINCPKNKLPMPRDLWYRIVYSQLLEQQLGSGEASISQIQLDSKFRSKKKRKYKEDNKSNSNNPHQQQTMNAAISSTSNKIIKLDLNDQLDKFNQENLPSVLSNSYKSFPTLVDNFEYIAETLPLEIQSKHSQLNLINSNIKSKENLEIPHDKLILSTQSADAELIHYPKIHGGLSADAKLEQSISISNVPLESIVLNNQSNFNESLPIESQRSNQSNKITDNNFPTNFSVIFNHPLINQLYEYYNLEDIPRFQLFKRLNRRLTHIRQTLKIMSSNDIELKLKYKRDALVKKRQTPVQSLTKDERIAMVELELNIYEYVQALDEPSSKCFDVNNNDQLETSPILSSYDTALPVIENSMLSGSSVTSSLTTFDTVRPSVISQSTALLSTITQFSDKTEPLTSWNHPLESNLLNMFESLTPLQKMQIHKQLARRYEHICKKAQKLNKTQLQTQIDSKSKALEQTKKILQPNHNELLRIAELELCLYELRHEQLQRD